MSDDTLTMGLARVRARFVTELRERFRRIGQLRHQLEGHVGNHEALREIGEISHKLAGTAATLGFPELGKSATLVDDLILSNPGVVIADGELLEHIDKLHAIMHAILGDHEPICQL